MTHRSINSGLWPVVVLVAAVCSSFAQSKPPALMPGLGQHHHTISTKSPEAQRFFDQGLTLVFAFNHDEAVRAFRRASELDPQSAMTFWGLALALGPCINLDVDPPHEQAAFDAVQKALSHASGATEGESAYIQALAKRYSSDSKVDLRKLDAEYANAMRELSQHYPDDLDAATLYAESLMDLHPWKLWGLDGRPTEGTEEIVAVLESVLRRDPDHLGANHYYIHAVEASPHPEWALSSARRLETLAPAAGHLVHMPAHTYMRVGDYSAAAQSTAAGANVDRTYLRESGTSGSMYDMMYRCHNLHFLAAADSMRGDFTGAKTGRRSAGCSCRSHAQRHANGRSLRAYSNLCTRSVPSLGRNPEAAPTEPQAGYDDRVLAFRPRVCICRKGRDCDGRG